MPRQHVYIPLQRSLCQDLDESWTKLLLNLNFLRISSVKWARAHRGLGHNCTTGAVQRAIARSDLWDYSMQIAEIKVEWNLSVEIKVQWDLSGALLLVIYGFDITMPITLLYRDTFPGRFARYCGTVFIKVILTYLFYSWAKFSECRICSI